MIEKTKRVKKKPKSLPKRVHIQQNIVKSFEFFFLSVRLFKIHKLREKYPNNQIYSLFILNGP